MNYAFKREENKFELNESWALIEANKCLKCYNAPCTQACPVHIDVPKFIYRISTRDYKGAIDVISEKNIFGATCGIVCPAEELCQKACSYSKLDRPIEISALQEFIMKKYLSKGEKKAVVIKEKRREKVAIIGAGPSGLTVASELGKEGFNITIYEKERRAGGLPLYEIPFFHLNKDILEQEINNIFQSEMNFKYNTEVKGDIVKEILDKYDVIYIATGSGTPKEAIIAKGKGIYNAKEFLVEYNQNKIKKENLGNLVIVMGGGNTAMDVAISAKKLGVEHVKVMYRRSKFEMPSWGKEFFEAVAAGVEFLWQFQPTDIVVVDDRLKSIKYCEVVLEGIDKSGRRKPKLNMEKQYEMEINSLIWALGRKSNNIILKEFNLKTDKYGMPEINKDFQTSIPKVFAGGDLVNGGSTVVQAISDGKKAAMAISNYLLSN